MDFFSKILDFNKIPVKLFVLLSIVSGSLLFFPNTVLENLKLTQFEKDYGKYFGIAFIISTGILLMNFAIWLFKKILFNIFVAKNIKAVVSELNNLDTNEKSVLREFFIRQSNTIDLPLDNATVKGLLNKGLLVRISTMGQLSFGGMLFPMKINEKVKGKVDDEILGITSFSTDDEKFNFVLNNRPDWVVENERMRNLLRF